MLVAAHLVGHGDRGEPALDGRDLGAGVGEALEVLDDGLRGRRHRLAVVQVAPQQEIVPVDAIGLPGVLRLGVLRVAADPGGRQRRRLRHLGQLG